MKISSNTYDWLISLLLTLAGHLLIFFVAALPGNNILFPYFRSHKSVSMAVVTSDMSSVERANGIYEKSDQKNQDKKETNDLSPLPYSLANRLQTAQPQRVPLITAFALPPVQKLFDVDRINQRSLSQETAVTKLLPPVFSDSTIPSKPEEAMWEKVRDKKESYILGDIFKDTTQALYTRKELESKEALFTRQVREDILDGILDMKFSTYIISAEYYYLSKILIERGLQPGFTLDEAFARYNKRLKRIKAGIPQELDVYSLIMILQRYADNKFYPENGSGLLLESLFHNLNDCEGGTKEILAYLDDLYPELEIGSNRGMLRTTTGEIIGHMQVYIAPGKAAEKILPNEDGIIVETTRIGPDSILPYSAGDIFPLEDFIFSYYPSLVAGTPLAVRLKLLYGSGVETQDQRKIVGTSDHPLKMSYGVTPTLLTAQYYDLTNIRTRKIVNEFTGSRFATCDPQIDPLQIDFTNVFSNFVAVDRSMRKNLIGHYLAALPYWNNEVMPQWKEPSFIATYDDFAGTLLEKNRLPERYIRIDAEYSVLPKNVDSHKVLLNYIITSSKAEKSEQKYLEEGGNRCKDRVLLTDQLLTFLFQSPVGPGVFFLPELDEKFSWALFSNAVLNDCLAIPDGQGKETLLSELETEADNQQLSLRKMLYSRLLSRNPVVLKGNNHLQRMTVGLESLFTGLENGGDIDAVFRGRHSVASSSVEASVFETVAEQGGTGINTSLLVDGYDFLGAKRLMELMVLYGKRGDLHLSLARANFMIQNILMLLASGEIQEKEIILFLDRLGQPDIEEAIQFGAVAGYAQYMGLNPEEVSTVLVNLLERKKKYDSEILITLLNYGLLKEDAVSFYRSRLDTLLSRLPSLVQFRKYQFRENFFIELFELIRTIIYFDDGQMQKTIAYTLSKSLIEDFTQTSSTEFSQSENLDYGIILNKLYSLAVLIEEKGSDDFRFNELHFLEKFIRFAGRNPIGKIMISLVEKLYSADSFVAALIKIKRGQQATIENIYAGISARGNHESVVIERMDKDKIDILKNVVGDANVLAYFFSQMDGSSIHKIAGQPATVYFENEKSKGFWYLDQLHKQLGQIDFSRLAAKDRSVREQHGAKIDSSDAVFGSFAGNFYQDDRVRESLSLLAYFAPEKKRKSKIKFRKIKDIRSLKDLMDIKVKESSRKVTRQDMSLLTLSLNGINNPKKIRQAWEATLGVVKKHLDMELTQDQKEYLFAPHYPYLIENNSGFIYSPEKVEDIHNAEKWGGRNDILLSSYLHFRNLTGRLPDWLLRTAIKRSRSELKIIDKLEEQSFLPMILECESDREELPDSLFSAKWKIRKPYGEDIFPGTLLLLRLGYLTITQQGEIVLVENMGSRKSQIIN